MRIVVCETGDRWRATALYRRDPDASLESAGGAARSNDIEHQHFLEPSEEIFMARLHAWPIESFDFDGELYKHDGEREATKGCNLALKLRSRQIQNSYLNIAPSIIRDRFAQHFVKFVCGGRVF